MTEAQAVPMTRIRASRTHGTVALLSTVAPDCDRETWCGCDGMELGGSGRPAIRVSSSIATAARTKSHSHAAAAVPAPALCCTLHAQCPSPCCLQLVSMASAPSASRAP